MLIAAVNQGRQPIGFNILLSPAITATFLPSVIGFYIFNEILYERLFAKKKFMVLILAIIIVCFLSSVITETLLYSIYKRIDQSFNTIFFSGLFLSFITFVNGIIGLVIKGFITSYNDIKLKEELNAKNYQMELALIKSQIDPHFLFNTINNIDILIGKDGEKASLYLNKLSDIMRFMLYESKTERINLKKEVSYIEKYIELQKIRTSNDKYVNFSIEGNPDAFMVEPMLFIPFIENAFKHTENKSIENAINVHLNIEKTRITFKCSNRYTKYTQANRIQGGLGNKLMQRRLSLLYPNRYDLNIVNESEVYSVTLIINEHEN